MDWSNEPIDDEPVTINGAITNVDVAIEIATDANETVANGLATSNDGLTLNASNGGLTLDASNKLALDGGSTPDGKTSDGLTNACIAFLVASLIESKYELEHDVNEQLGAKTTSAADATTIDATSTDGAIAATAIELKHKQCKSRQNYLRDGDDYRPWSRLKIFHHGPTSTASTAATVNTAAIADRQ